MFKSNQNMSVRGIMNNPYCSNDCSHCAVKSSLSFLKCKHGFCRKCLTTVKDNHSCLVCAGQCELVLDFQNTALKYLDESFVLDLEPTDVTALRNNAIFWFKQTLFQNSHTPKIHNKLCPLLIETKDYEQSVYYLYEGVKLYPEEYTLWYSLSCVFLTVGNPFSAAEYLTAAVSTLEESSECTPELLSKYKEALVVIVQIVTETGLVDKFRFRIGDTVEYNVDDGKGCGTSMWKKGRIEGLFYRECDWPLKKIVPYQMLDLDSCCCFDTNCKMRRYAYCNYDIKDCMVAMPYQNTTADNLRQYQLVVGKNDLLNLVQKRVSREDFVWFQSVYDVYFDNLMTFTVPLVDRAVVNSASSMLQYIALRVVTVIPAASEEYFLARLAANTLDPEGKLLLIERNTLVACQYDHSLNVRFSETNIQLYRQAAVSGNNEAITALCMYLFSQIMLKAEPERPFTNYLAPLGDNINAVRTSDEMVEMWEKLVRLSEANHVSWFMLVRAVELRANFYMQMEDTIEGILERHDEGAFCVQKEPIPQPIVREFVWCNNPFCLGSTYRGCKWNDCERCRKVKYCSKECQTAHSKKHKKKCKDIKALAAAEESGLSESSSVVSDGSTSSYSLKSTGSSEDVRRLGSGLSGLKLIPSNKSPLTVTVPSSSSSPGSGSSRTLPTAPANEHTAPMLKREALPITTDNSSKWASFMIQTLRRECVQPSSSSHPAVKYVPYKNVSSVSALRSDAAEFIKINKHARAAKCYTMIIHNMYNSRFWEDSTAHTQHKCDECAHAVLERIKCYAKLANDMKSLRITEQLIADIVNMLRNSLFERMRINNAGIVKLLNSLYERSVKFQRHLVSLSGKSQSLAKNTVLSAAKTNESYDIQVVRCQVIVSYGYATNAATSEDYCPLCHTAWGEFQTVHSYAVVLPCTHAVCVRCLSKHYKECQTHNNKIATTLQAALTEMTTVTLPPQEFPQKQALFYVGTPSDAAPMPPPPTSPPPPAAPEEPPSPMKFCCHLCHEVICADVIGELAGGMISQSETNIFAPVMTRLLLLTKAEQDAVLRTLLIQYCFDFSAVEKLLYNFVGLIYYQTANHSAPRVRVSACDRSEFISAQLSVVESLERDFASTSAWIYCMLNTSSAEYNALQERLAGLEMQISSARSHVVRVVGDRLQIEGNKESDAKPGYPRPLSTSSVNSDDSGSTTDDNKENGRESESATLLDPEEPNVVQINEVKRERIVDLSGLSLEEVHNTLTYFVVPLLKVCKNLLMRGECFQFEEEGRGRDSENIPSFDSDNNCASHFLHNKHVRYVQEVQVDGCDQGVIRVFYTPDVNQRTSGCVSSEK